LTTYDKIMILFHWKFLLMGSVFLNVVLVSYLMVEGLERYAKKHNRRIRV
jgi:hypothetical protein